LSILNVVDPSSGARNTRPTSSSDSEEEAAG
jgi:hypothetical protein